MNNKEKIENIINVLESKINKIFLDIEINKCAGLINAKKEQELIDTFNKLADILEVYANENK